MNDVTETEGEIANLIAAAEQKRATIEADAREWIAKAEAAQRALDDAIAIKRRLDAQIITMSDLEKVIVGLQAERDAVAAEITARKRERDELLLDVKQVEKALAFARKQQLAGK